MLKDKVFLDNLPNQPGIYQMLDEKRTVLYVGKARDLKKRVLSYFSAQTKELKTLNLIKNAHSIEVTITHTEHEALLLECFLIKKHKPRYNVLLRDDKSYPYILITDEKPYPRIGFYRGVKKGKGLYFGPYSSAAAVRETVHIIQKLFHLRTCSDSYFTNRQRPCLHYQIGLCSGSCTGLISPEEYQQNVEHTLMFLKGKSQEIIHQLQRKMEHAAATQNYEFAAKVRDQMAYLEEIQEKQYVSSGHESVDILSLAQQAGIACLYLLSIREGRLLGSRAYFPTLPAEAGPQEIISAFIGQHYLGVAKDDIPEELVMGEALEDQELLETALSEQSQHRVKLLVSQRGERRKWLEMAESNAKQALAGRLIQKTNLEERFVELQKSLELDKLPKRIECFDISHSMGEETVASCVVFNREGPLKSDYRRFNINGIRPGDDVAAMHQVIERRFKGHSGDAKPKPDLILIDGGATQLAAAERALAELGVSGIVLVGVSKGEGRKPGLETLHFSAHNRLHLAPDSLGLHLIQQVRDEAHRFAITGHRLRRDKKRRTSVLESIPGIGAARRRALLKHFGGLQALEAAEVEQILEVPGMNQALAERVYEALH